MLVLPYSKISVALVGLYLAQAVPLYLVAAALPPILRENGVGLDVIGGLNILLAPWVLKAFWASWVDRLSHDPRIGRKKIIGLCLTVTVSGILALSALNPVEDAALFFPILMIMSVSSATQDIASDGWAVEHLSPKQQPGGNALQGTQQGRAKESGNAVASNYPGKVMRRIARVRKPRVSTRTKAVVSFGISASGNVSQVSVSHSSGSSAFDKAAIGAIRKAAPFPAPPKGAQRFFRITIKSN